MSMTCTHQHVARKSDAFCSSCGNRLKRRTLVADNDYIPVPGVVGQPDIRTLKKRRSTPWYRKPMSLITSGLALFTIVGVAAITFL